MEGSGSSRGAQKEGDEVEGSKEAKEEVFSSHKSASSKFKERWLMTRKTWRYMADAGKKLFPEGVNPQKPADVTKVQEHFQKACSRSNEYILWPCHGGDGPSPSTSVDQQPIASSGARKKEKRKPADLDNLPADNFDSSSSSLPCSPTQLFTQGDFPPRSRERHLSDCSWILPPELYSQLVRCYGTSTLQHVASRLLEEQLTEEDEYEYDEEDGVEILEIDGKRMRSIGAQTDSHLDMCVQTDQDDSAEDMVKVGAETRAETEAAFALAQAQKREAENADPHKADEDLPQPPESHSSHKGNPKSRTHLPIQVQPQQPPPPFQKETPVLKKFWGRRESKSNEQIQSTVSPGDKSRGLASDKDREAPPPKGGVAAKLASLEAASTVHSPKNTVPSQQAQKPGTGSPQPAEKPLAQSKHPEKKSLKSVFKLGLKCDLDSSDSPRKALEKQNADKFRTVNYDKALRNIKSKWTKEDDELLMKMLAEQQQQLLSNEVTVPSKEIPKKKRKSRGIQVGEALPQFILSAFRVSSPVEIFYATRRRIRRRSSKAESTDLSGSDGSVSLASSIPTSPRYSMTVADESNPRNILLSEAEAFRLAQIGKRASFDTAARELSDHEGAIPNMAPSYQRSYSAQHALGSRFCNPQSFSCYSRSQRANLLQYLLPAVMQRSRAGGSSGTSHHYHQHHTSGSSSSRLVAKRIWKTRSKSQSRASAATTSTWTPMVSTFYHLYRCIYFIPCYHCSCPSYFILIFKSIY